MERAVGTMRREFIGASIIEVTVGSTGPCGGDSGHGGRTFFQIKNLAGADLRFTADPGGVEVDTSFIRIMVGGDDERENLIEALGWATETLRVLGAE